MNDEGLPLTSQDDIKEEILKFYNGLLGSRNKQVCNSVEDLKEIVNFEEHSFSLRILDRVLMNGRWLDSFPQDPNSKIKIEQI